MGTDCMELWFLDRSRSCIDCTAVENAYADNMYEHSELDYLSHNAPEAYVEFILAGEAANDLRAVTQYGET